MKNIKALENKWKKLPLLFMKKIEYVEEPDIKTFLHNFLHKHSKECITYQVGNNRNVSHTHARRSIQDMYRLCCYYFTGVTLEEVLRSIFEITKESSDIHADYCYVIQRLVFRTSSPSYGLWKINSSSRLESGEDCQISSLWRELGFTDNNFLK